MKITVVKGFTAEEVEGPTSVALGDGVGEEGLSGRVPDPPANLDEDLGRDKAGLGPGEALGEP